jgi:hypothetical protein
MAVVWAMPAIHAGAQVAPLRDFSAKISKKAIWRGANWLHLGISLIDR